jgi:putative hemolysin
VYCTQKGYGYEIRKNPDGSEYGVCIFPDKAECEEWAFYQDTCNESTGK